MKSSLLVPRLVATSLLPALLLLAGCGAKEPDWAFYSRLVIPAEEACGRQVNGEELMRLAYEGEPFDGLADPEPLPEDAVQAANSLGSFRHTFPCAADAVAAREALAASGYTELSLTSESARAYVFSGRDPVGVEGHYVRFACDWVSDLAQELDPPPPWSALAAGISGSFGTVPASSERYDALDELAAITFRTRMMKPVPSLSAYPLTEPVFLSVEDSFSTVDFSEGEGGEYDAFAFCATWVEHDVYDRCDYVYLGKAFHLMLDEATGTFHQTILLRQSLGVEIVGLEGWCRRE